MLQLRTAARQRLPRSPGSGSLGSPCSPCSSPPRATLTGVGQRPRAVAAGPASPKPQHPARPMPASSGRQPITWRTTPFAIPLAAPSRRLDRRWPSNARSCCGRQRPPPAAAGQRLVRPQTAERLAPVTPPASARRLDRCRPATTRCGRLSRAMPPAACRRRACLARSPSGSFPLGSASPGRSPVTRSTLASGAGPTLDPIKSTARAWIHWPNVGRPQASTERSVPLGMWLALVVGVRCNLTR
jgi:hypothetical protein